jgi:DNA invertase Pin-like site-specific DNA recombinase
MEDENIENQINAIKDFASENGFELLGIFRDVGVSGGEPALKRDGFLTMYNSAKQLGIKDIIIFDLTRLGRDMLDVLETLKKLEEEGFRVYFVKHPELNQFHNSILGDAMRRAMIALLAVLAEVERAMIRERTKAALERAKKQGRPPGRPGLKVDCREVQKIRERGVVRPSDICKVLKAEGKLQVKHKDGRVEDASIVTCVKKVKQCIKKQGV